MPALAQTPFLHAVPVVQAYDQHLNMVLGDVEETVTSVEIDEETFEEIIKVGWRGGSLIDLRRFDAPALRRRMLCVALCGC